MREYKLLISHVGKDKEIAMKCVKALDITVEEGENTFKIVPVYMESETNGCFGDFAVWTENAVKSCDGVLAVITENTAETKVSADGVCANVKVVYDEISLARGTLKDIVVLRKNGVELESGYNLRLENVKCEFYDSKPDIAISNIVTDVILHAKRRFAGHPLLEYAGKVAVRLKPSVVPNTSEYLGREDKLKEIEDCFKNNKRVVCITGFGGIGKTTLAKMYADKHREEPVVIQYCSAEETSLKNAVVSLTMEYDSPEFDKMTIDERYALRLRQLGNLDTQTLIIIDNFNADFGTVNNREVLAELSSMQKCKFIISSRQTLNVNDVGVVNVGKLNDEELVELFYRISDCERTEENNECIKKLIECTNGHTMTIELSAKAVAIDENAVTLQEIVDSFLYSDALTHVQDRHDGYDEYETIYEHLRKLFNLSNIVENEKKLLGALSFVARRGLTAKELKENFEYNKKELIRLVNLGYIAKSKEGAETYYSLHPLLSELAFNDFVQSADEFENIIRFLVAKKSQTTNNDTVADLDMRIDYAEHIYCRLSTISNKTLFVRGCLSATCNGLGDIARAKGDIKLAEEYYIQEYKLTKAIMEETGTLESRRGLSISCDRLGDIAQAKGDLETAEENYNHYYELTKAIMEETGTIQSRRDLSISCERLGDIAQAKGDLKIAEEYYIQGYELRKVIVDKTGKIQSRRDLSISCNKLGDIAQANGDLKTAEDYYTKGYELRKVIVDKTGTIESRRDLSISCERLGDIAQANGDLKTAEDYYTKGYELSKAIMEATGTIKSREDLSRSCERLGDIARTKGNLKTAEEYYIQDYELAKAICEKTKTVQSFNDLMASYYKLSTVADSFGRKEQYLCAAFEIAEKLFKQNVDHNGRYRALAQALAQELAELYKDAGAVDEYNKMKEILESLS